MCETIKKFYTIKQQFQEDYIMDFTNISILTPIKPEIELDGGYAYCTRCTTEIFPNNNKCLECGQIQDWSWFGKTKKTGGN